MQNGVDELGQVRKNRDSQSATWKRWLFFHVIVDGVSSVVSSALAGQILSLQ
jgi:hypothetical protein